MGIAYWLYITNNEGSFNYMPRLVCVNFGDFASWKIDRQNNITVITMLVHHKGRTSTK